MNRFSPQGACEAMSPTTTASTDRVLVKFPDRMPGLEFQAMRYGLALGLLARDGRIDIYTREEARDHYAGMDWTGAEAYRFGQAMVQAWGEDS